MNRPTFEDTRLAPLTTDAEIHTRASQLVGRAISRQLWIMFLDDDDIQLPLLIPIDGLPALPSDDQAAEVLDRIGGLMPDIGAVSIVVVFERYGPPTLSHRDLEWARSISVGCEGCGIVLRAQLLSHRGGVRWITADDLGSF